MTTLRELAELLTQQVEKAAPTSTAGYSTYVNPDRPVLWQYIAKEHAAPDASDEEWEQFVHGWENEFADRISVMARRDWNGRS